MGRLPRGPRKSDRVHRNHGLRSTKHSGSLSRRSSLIAQPFLDVTVETALIKQAAAANGKLHSRKTKAYATFVSEPRRVALVVRSG